MAELYWKVYPLEILPNGVTGSFGANYGGYLHRGTDVGVPIGTPVVAPQDGRAVDVFNPDRSFGNAVCIDHEGTGWFSLYAHLAAAYVVTGQRVEAGDLIGLSGNTGMSTGPHLHWQVSVDRHMPTDINLSRDAMKVPFEPADEEDDMTPDERRLLLLVSSVVGGWTNGQEFTSVEEALPSFETFEGQDQRVLMGMGALGTSITQVANALLGHLNDPAELATATALLEKTVKDIEALGVATGID